MTLKFLDDYINQKMSEDDEYVVLKFFELRVKYGLSKEDTDYALYLAKQKLENNNYKVYLTNDTYEYNGEEKKVQDNELLVAVKYK